MIEANPTPLCDTPPEWQDALDDARDEIRQCSRAWRDLHTSLVNGWGATREQVDDADRAWKRALATYKRLGGR